MGVWAKGNKVTNFSYILGEIILRETTAFQHHRNQVLPNVMEIVFVYI
ncbi:MAG: hypothetical protein ACOYI2_07920 [Bacillota bacterium]|nr:hypothetical protein [Clostridia bacterium]